MPTDETISNPQAVKIDATYLYADLANSSRLAQLVPPLDAARVIRAYVNVAVTAIRHKDGHIRSFDGDRVMGIFIGPDQETRAARTALALNAYVSVMREYIPKKLGKVKVSGWSMDHGVGIDTGEAHMIRAGIRNNADLVSVGAAPNIAAKLSDIRDDHSLHLTKAVWDRMSYDVSYKQHPDGRSQDMWPHSESDIIGGRRITYYGSNWTWPYG